MSSDRRTSFRLIPTRTFLKDMEKLDKSVNQRIVRSLEDLPNYPYIGKPLRGDLKGLYSLRMGEYRIIYSLEVKNNQILLYAAKHRSKVYEG